ncbi:hypothetical protein LX36DRAFT_266387 [Colletotrichum falcatum]|nr:hypothetical protein LX36DRAFT_266387 [Colletotrichum falcatum]
MMPRRPHLELFNPAHPKTEHQSFTLFAQLPAELRILIWQHALERHRMIHIVLEERVERGTGNESKIAERYSLLNGLGRSVSGNHYRVVTPTRNALLPGYVMMVNKEAQAVVLAFYSVHIPCYLKSSVGTESKTSILRLNLDWDYLRISAGNALPLFFDFLHDLRAYDPGGRGLDMLTWMRVNVFNYGFPVFPSFTFFEPPLPDSRDISRDLRNVGGSVPDWRERPLGWRMLLRRLGISPENVEGGPGVDVRVMVASDREEDIRTREDAARALHEEDFDWLQLQWWFRGWDTPRPGGGGGRPAGCFTTASGLRPTLPELDGPKALALAPRPALGFWLFPVHVFGDIPEEEDSTSWIRSKGIFDLSSYWPDLVLVDVP